MARKTRRAPAPATSTTSRPASLWLTFILTALISAALSASITLAVVSHHPTPKPEYLTLGNTYFDQQNWPLAVQYYTKAIDSGIDNPDIRTDLGTAYRNLSKPQQALEQFQTAQNEDPHHENSLFNQGVVYVALLNEPQKALAIWREYLQRFPQGQHVQDAQHLIADITKNSGPITGNDQNVIPRH
jgi:tetratricopeptide (TPR) repeat protein